MNFLTDFQITAGAATLTILLYFVYFQLRTNRSLRLPPGPRPMPILGNILQMTLEFPERRFAEWKKTYGALVLWLHLLADEPYGPTHIDRGCHLPADVQLAGARSQFYYSCAGVVRQTKYQVLRTATLHTHCRHVSGRCSICCM